jgi:hypothetical protein
MNSIKNVTVVIRSVNERTEELCKKLILNQGVKVENVFVIHERPFSRAMRVGYQLGTERGLPWTYCVDADVLLKQNAVSEMLKKINKLPDSTLGISGELLDKFRGKKHTAGNHLFRTEHLPKLIDEIKPYKAEDIRPESTAIKKLGKQGLRFFKNVSFIGLHDFEQHYHDIARKAFTHSKKHSVLLTEFVHFWSCNSRKDPDFKAALYGLSKGLIHFEEVKINADDFVSLYDEVLENFGSKSENISDFEVQSFDDIEKAMTNRENYFEAGNELQYKIDKDFRTTFNHLSYPKLLKRIGGKMIADIKRKLSNNSGI